MQDAGYGLPRIPYCYDVGCIGLSKAQSPGRYPHTPGAGDGGRAASVVAADLQGVVGEGTSGGYSRPLALRTHAAVSAGMT
jgi:hypothetical protein